MIKLKDYEVPKWVRKAQAQWEARLGQHPYGMTKTFTGRTFIYTCYFKTEGQGRVSEHWIREKRHKRSLLSRLFHAL